MHRISFIQNQFPIKIISKECVFHSQTHVFPSSDQWDKTFLIYLNPQFSFNNQF